MTTFSDRILLRWAPISTLLAAGAAVGLTVGPRPFGYHNWPRPEAGRPQASVVQVPSPSDPAPVAVPRLVVSRGAVRARLPQPIALASVRVPAAPAQPRHPRTQVGPGYRPPTPQPTSTDGRPTTRSGDRGAAPAGPDNGGKTLAKADGPAVRSIAARVNVDRPPPARPAVRVRLEPSSREPRHDRAPRPAATAWRPASGPLP